MSENELIADAIAAENVRSYLDGSLKHPAPGTLAHRVANESLIKRLLRWARG